MDIAANKKDGKTMRLIDIDKVLEEVRTYGHEAIERGHTMNTVDCVIEILHIIDSMPAIDAEPVVHGRWKRRGRAIVCSKCAEPYFVDMNFTYKYSYCPCCGTKMDGE